jgi:hypothetical protein
MMVSRQTAFLKEDMSMIEGQQQKNINTIQRLYFELFRLVRYNLLDGELVVRDLLEWRDLWYSVFPTRFPYLFREPGDKEYRPYTELSMLRTVSVDSWPADTLYIWTNDEALPQLRQRIEERWQPGEVVVISPETDKEMQFAHLDDEHDRVLFVWWD